MDGMQYRYEFQRGQGKALHSEERETGPPQSKAVLALCWVALAATIVRDALFESMKLGGVTSADVSNEVFAWFAPAGYVFAIWGVIYAALVVWMLSATPIVANEVSTIAIVVGLLVAAFAVARTQNDLVFPLVVLWAAVGVGVHLMQVDFTVARVLFALSVIGALVVYIPPIARMVSSRSAGPEPLAGE